MYEIVAEYANSRRIEYNRWSEAKEVIALVEELGELVTSRKKDGYLWNLRLVVIDLYQAWLVDPSQYVAYFRGEEHYKFIDKYNPNKRITYDYFIKSIDLLATNGYIKNKPGGNYENEEHGEYGFLSRMRADNKLIVMFEAFNLTPEMVSWYKFEADLVRLKDVPREKEVFDRRGFTKTVKIKDLVDYDEDKRANYVAKKMIKQLVAYNKLLDLTYVDIDVECISDEDKLELKKKQSRKKDKDHFTRIDLSRKRVYRVFNNKSWKSGGRFYGGWWISTPGTLRKHIYINGEPTVELDFKGMHIHFLYAIKGISYAPLQDDPYSLVEDDPNRKLNKLLLLTAFNAVTEDEAIYSTSRNIDNDELEVYGLKKRTKCKTLRAILAKLKDKHKDIADLIADENNSSNIGSQLQYLDSCVAAKVINYFTSKKIPVLTVHDSVICAAKYEVEVRDRMLNFYKEVINSEYNLNLVHYSYKAVGVKELPTDLIKIDPTEASRRLLATRGYSPVLGKTDYKTASFLERELIITVDIDTKVTNCTKECSYNSRSVSYRAINKIIHYKRIDLESILII